jgi:hypothetical protein
MSSISMNIRSFAFGAALLASSTYAVAGPTSPLPPFPPGSGSGIVAAGPTRPLPPFPPGSGSGIVAVGPTRPLPPFPPGSGSGIVAFPAVA